MSYPGWIDLGAGVDPIPCYIEDASKGGAKLAVENVGSIPEQFQLRFSLTGQTSRPCIVRRRLPDGVGVQFVRFLKDENAATAIEYGLIAAGIAVAIIPVITGLGTHLKSTFTTISSALK
jgi:pilus assembly protein Flp/PilA